MTKKEKKYFIASVKDDHIHRIKEVAEALEARGCEIRHVLFLTGTITGRVDKNVELNDILVEGIASIENQRTLRKK